MSSHNTSSVQGSHSVYESQCKICISSIYFALQSWDELSWTKRMSRYFLFYWGLKRLWLKTSNMALVHENNAQLQKQAAVHEGGEGQGMAASRSRRAADRSTFSLNVSSRCRDPIKRCNCDARFCGTNVFGSKMPSRPVSQERLASVRPDPWPVLMRRVSLHSDLSWLDTMVWPESGGRSNPDGRRDLTLQEDIKPLSCKAGWEWQEVLQNFQSALCGFLWNVERKQTRISCLEED